MGVFRTNDATQFDDIDGIIIDEQSPATQISGVAANVGVLVGQFQRGPAELSLPLSSIGEMQEIYGKSDALGNKQLRNKAFGRIRIIRVEAAAAAKATLAVSGVVEVTAKGTGAYGNNITVQFAEVPANPLTHFKLTVIDTNPNAVLPAEVYDNVELANVGSTFAGSKLVDVSILSLVSGLPTFGLATNLAGGDDGTIADTDYETAIARAEVLSAGNVLFIDENNSVRNGYLEAHAGLNQDKMVIIAGAENDDRAAVIPDAANFRDVDGRIIYAWPWVKTTINGLQEFTNPSAWVASVFTQVAPSVALSYVNNARFLAGATGLKFETGRAGHIALDEAGILAMENDPDVGIVIKNAVTTQILNSQKKEILRRRMADFLQDSIARGLKNFQNDVNSKERRTEAKAMILDFDTRLVLSGILPGEQDVNSGKPLLVDTESLNTDSVIAQGLFKIAYKRRIFSSMRYIVLQAEIGTNVVVTEVEG